MCRAAVHHGGAGTTAAGILAGLPVLVCSVFADQPFWGERLRDLGVGAHIPYSRLTEGRLEGGLRAVLDPGMRVRAARVQAVLQAETPGVSVAADLVERAG
jgi:UDP:flavonoid glycosyltransferase YjiC (YdhE family)